jgi:hypothetical protein
MMRVYIITKWKKENEEGCFEYCGIYEVWRDFGKAKCRHQEVMIGKKDDSVDYVLEEHEVNDES